MKLLFRIPHYLQKICARKFFGKVLPGNKTENDDSPQTQNTKYSEDRSDCVKSIQKRGFCGSYFPAFGMNAEIYGVKLRIHSECRKIRTRKNSVYGHYSRCEWPTILSIQLQSTMLQLGTQDNVFKTATKWLCTIYSIIKALRLSGKNAERGFHNLIHKQAIWEAFCRWSVTFLRAKLKYSQLPTLRKWPNREKEANFQSQFSYQNAVLLIKFHAGGKIFFPSRSYDI